ncbi:MAG TPA: DinB family protein [Burkholderiales bacterium]|nr:DinB family protein [Burkholderiales bacterium]
MLIPLTRYKQWANERLFGALALVPEEDLARKQPIVFGSLLRTLNHVRAMDLVWKAHLEGRPHGFTTRNPETSPPFAELRASQSEVDAWYVQYAEGLSPAAAAEVVTFEFIGGGKGSLSRAEMLLHAVNHGTYHRGNVAAMLYQIGRNPPTTDLPVYLREVRTAQAA